jgi:hypothetical protein
MTARPPKITKRVSSVRVWPGLLKVGPFFFGWRFQPSSKVHSTIAKPTKIGKATRRKAMLRNFKVLFVVVAVIAISITTYAFAAANTVPDTKAGDGLGTVSGYTVTSVAYTLNGADPSTLDSVAFDVGAAAITVEVQLVATTGSWYACALDTGTVWSCTTTGLDVSTIDQLRVVATSN